MNEPFGEKLKSLRLNANLSQKELASRLELSPSTLSAYETGRRNPDGLTLKHIADFFKMDWKEFLQGPHQLLEPVSEVYVSSDMRQRKMDNLHVDHLSARIQESLQTLKTHKDVKHGRLERFTEVFNKLRSILPDANSNNTSLNALEKIDNALTIIRAELEHPASIDYERIDLTTDTLLEVMPLIVVSRSAGVDTKRKEEMEKLFESLSALYETAHGDAQKSLSNLENLEVEGQRLSQLLAGRVLNDYFEKRANEEKKSAFKWTVATWVFAGLTVGALIATYIITLYVNNQNTEFNLQLLGTKILITAALGFIAKWASKRANRDLTEEAKYHRLAVNMATINSFIAPLNDAEKNAVISAVAIKTFTEVSGTETTADFETPNVIDMAKGFLTKGEK